MRTVSLLCLVAATLPSFSWAATTTTSFRCKTDLVNVGDGKASALLKCGPPLLQDSFCKPASIVQPLWPRAVPMVVVAVACESVDEWTYNPGYGQFMTTLRFESGKLVQISYGDRVK